MGPKIGEGVFGHIHYAEDLHQKQYAMKIIDLNIKSKPEIVKRLAE